MTTPTLNRLLISHITLRGPELYQLYTHIHNHPGRSYPELVAHFVPAGVGNDDFSLSEATLREALNFLLVANLVEQRGNSRFKATFAATPLLTDAHFSLLLLYHIRMHSDERQRAPVLIYQQLAAEDVLTTTSPVLRDQMERGNNQNLFAWTGEKIGFWLHLFSFLGLVRRPERSNEMLILPQLSLVLAALNWAQTHAAVSLASCLEMLDATFFACFTARGRVHCGLSQTLLALDSLGLVQLTHHADASHSLLLGERRVSDIYVRV